MPRPKSPKPTPKHVTPFAKAVRAAKGAKRKGKKLRVVAGTAAARALGIK